VFSRQHYEAVAKILRDAKTLTELAESAGHNPTPWYALHSVQIMFGDVFAADNERFDIDRFTAACRRPESI